MASPRHAAPYPRSATSGEVVVWWASLDVNEAELARAEGLLSTDEAERAARFMFPIHRARWIVARAVLRRIIAAQVDADPVDLCFTYGPAGKPALGHPPAAVGFNLAHSGEYAAYAVTTGAEVGLDLEVVRPTPDLEDVAARFFSALENEVLRSLEGPERLRGFYECWTRKEAFLKATGDGLTRALDSFSVTLGPHVAPRLRHTSPDAEECDRWSLFSLEPWPGVVAAVALPRGEWRVRWTDACSLGQP